MKYFNNVPEADFPGRLIEFDAIRLDRMVTVSDEAGQILGAPVIRFGKDIPSGMIIAISCSICEGSTECETATLDDGICVTGTASPKGACSLKSSQTSKFKVIRESLTQIIESKEC